MKNEIIALHRQGKSNREISKILGIITKYNFLVSVQDYISFFNAFDSLLENKIRNKKEAITKSLEIVPIKYNEKILLAINSTEPEQFIKGPHDLSCSIDVALPIIYYLFNKHDSLLEALKENVVLGGASADRALLLALLYFKDELPKEWDNYIREI